MDHLAADSKENLLLPILCACIVLLSTLYFLCDMMRSSSSAARKAIGLRAASSPDGVARVRLDEKSDSRWDSLQMERSCELECARVLQFLLPAYEFKKIRPDWLKNPQTGRRLELDFYCAELQLAVEYNGMQHYRFTPRFHKTAEDLGAQQYRDSMKRLLCARRGVRLVVLHATPKRDIYTQLRRELVLVLPNSCQ